MKILRIRLCYEKGDRIIVDKESDLEKYDLSKVTRYEVETALSPEEFTRLRCFNQVVNTDTGTANANRNAITINPYSSEAQ